ncbi:unnamed protein product, partial [Adineta steineri]
MDTNDSTTQNNHLLFPNEQQQGQTKKCRGNRRNQRFRRKCRAHKMQPHKIEKLLKKRNHIHKKIQKQQLKRSTTNCNLQLIARTTNQSQPITTTTTNVFKRKRDISSQQLSNTTSSISIVQPSSKKMTTDINMNSNYRCPMYLTRSSSILCQILNKTLNYTLKKQDEKQFIHIQLELLDQQYCLEKDQELWQSYLDIGLQQCVWPNIKKQINHCQFELSKYSQTCPIRELSFHLIEQRLKELVARERKYLSQRNNDQLIKFKDDIHQAELFKQIYTNLPTTNIQEDYIGQLITIREKQSEIWKEQLMLEIRIHCKFLPQNLDHVQNFMAPISYLPLNNEQKSIEVKNKHYKIIQEAKRTWLNYLLNAYEIKITEYELQYQNAYINLESYVLTNMTTTSTSVLSQVQEYINCRISKLKNDIYNKMSSFRKIILQNRQRSSSTKDTIGVWPEPYLDLISNPFDTRQWNYLSLGPSYIRLNQSAIRPQVQQQAVIKDEHEDICKKVQNNLINKPHCIPRSNPIFTEYSNHLLNYLNQCYSSPLPYKIQLQTLEQAQILGSIRKIIKNMGLIIRVTDKGHSFYIGSSIEFEKKAQNFFSDTNAFEVLSNNPFNEIFDKVKQLLDKLCSKKLIMKWQYEEMMPDRTKCELAHLYFNPKTHKDGIPVRPIENTIPASTTKISKFLDKILRPLFQDKCKDTTIIDGAHLITELNKYSNKGLIKSTTLFCTFDIHNLYTMLPQEESLAILVEFLNVHGYKKVKCIDPITIKELASIVLQENAFAYDKKIYKQTTGGAMGSSFTLTLANIFMWHWQKRLVDEQTKTSEFYGRYIDDIFMTWNKSEQELKDLLQQANQWHQNIKLDYKISHSLPFLDVLLTNDYGILTTSVYHKPAAQPCVVPFTSDHPRHVFTNTIKTSLARAVRYSSTFKSFHYERRYIKLMLLYNGYPSTFIENEFNKCFFENQSTSPFLPFIYDENQFFFKRQKLLGIPTTRQSQTTISAATANINNDPTGDEIMQATMPTKNTEAPLTSYTDKLFIHYTHEKRFQSCKKDMHQVYEDIFKNTTAIHAKLIVGNKNRRNAQNELIRKKPNKKLLQNIIKQ